MCATLDLSGSHGVEEFAELPICDVLAMIGAVADIGEGAALEFSDKLPSMLLSACLCQLHLVVWAVTGSLLSTADPHVGQGNGFFLFHNGSNRLAMNDRVLWGLGEYMASMIMSQSPRAFAKKLDFVTSMGH